MLLVTVAVLLQNLWKRHVQGKQGHLSSAEPAVHGNFPPPLCSSSRAPRKNRCHSHLVVDVYCRRLGGEVGVRVVPSYKAAGGWKQCDAKLVQLGQVWNALPFWLYAGCMLCLPNLHPTIL